MTCPVCRDTGAIFRDPGGLDACPECARLAEAMYRAAKRGLARSSRIALIQDEMEERAAERRRAYVLQHSPQMLAAHEGE